MGLLLGLLLAVGAQAATPTPTATFSPTPGPTPYYVVVRIAPRPGPLQPAVSVRGLEAEYAYSLATGRCYIKVKGGTTAARTLLATVATPVTVATHTAAEEDFKQRTASGEVKTYNGLREPTRTP